MGQFLRIKLIMLSEKTKTNSEPSKKATGFGNNQVWLLLAAIVAIGLIVAGWYRLHLDRQPRGSKAEFGGVRLGALCPPQTFEDSMETKAEASQAPPRKDSPVLTELKKQVEMAEADSKAPKIASKPTQVKRLAKLLEAS